MIHDDPQFQPPCLNKNLPPDYPPTDSRIKLNRVNLLALDLGTKMGWASYDGEFQGGVLHCQPKPQRGHRYLKFRAFLETFDADKIYYEHVERHTGTIAAHVYGGFLAELEAHCAENDIPIEGVAVGTIKKFATGNGAAKKPEMIAAASKAWRFPVIDDNHADAICLLLLAMKAAPVRGYSGAVR